MFVVEAPQGAKVGQSFVRDGESWEIVHVFSLGYVVSFPNASLWSTLNVDYELI
jgi:hypothetical protein